MDWRNLPQSQNVDDQRAISRLIQSTMSGNLNAIHKDAVRRFGLQMADSQLNSMMGATPNNLSALAWSAQLADEVAQAARTGTDFWGTGSKSFSPTEMAIMLGMAANPNARK